MRGKAGSGRERVEGAGAEAGHDTFLVLDLSLDVLDGVRGLDLEGDGLASQSLNENLHFRLCLMTLVYTGNEGKLVCTAILRALTQY